MRFCQKCGKELLEDVKFCEFCGTEVAVQEAQNDANQSVAEEPAVDFESNPVAAEEIKTPVITIKKFVLTKKLAAILAGVIALLIIIVVLTANSGPNLKKIYKEHCEAIWSEVGSDGSYLHIDTNPYDEEDEGIAYYEAYSAVEKVNKELNCPDSLFDDMKRTSSNDGKQSEEFDKIIVTWKYHPDSGLEVTYKKK